MEEEEDDLYGGLPQVKTESDARHQTSDGQEVKHESNVSQEVPMGEAEQGEDDDDDSDSDIDIVLEQNGSAAPPSQAHNFSRSKAEPIRMSADTGSSTKPPPDTGNVKTEVAGQKMVMQDGSMYPEVRTSKLDLDQIPTFDALGKPITDVDLDADIALDTKPWRVPGTDPTDFFNYGFDEFTWVQYCLKQKQMRESITGMKSETKQFEAMLGGQPAQGMPAMPSMPGMPDMPPEMLAAMFGNMQANGGDPSQMDFGAMMQQMGGMPGMPGPGGQFGGMPPGPGFNPGGATPQQSANDDFGNTGDQRDGMFRQQGGYNRRGRGRGRY